MIMEGYAKRVSKFPKIAIFLVLLITVSAIFSMQFFGIDQDFSEESFRPDMEIARASDEVSEKFTTTRSVQILVKSKNDDVLTSVALVEILEIEKEFLEDDLIVSTLENPKDPSSNIRSVAGVIGGLLLNDPNVSSDPRLPVMDPIDLMILIIGNMNDSQIKETVVGILSSDQTPLEVKGIFSMLLTKDFNPALGHFSAKGTMISVSLNPESVGVDEIFTDSDESMISQAEKRMDEIVKNEDLKHNDITVMGGSLITDEIMKANNESMAILLPLAFGLVIVILAIIYRNLLDMLFSILALGFSIIWVYGFGALMGYSFNPMTTAVPILIVGLGIDYGIHITMRYREEIQSGKKIEDSIKIIIISVGMALLLATVTTVISFLSNLASPIGLLGEFGVLAAIGIIASFFTMITFVPACKQIRENRKLKKGKFNNNLKNNKNSKIKTVGLNFLNRAMGGGASAAQHHPLIVIILVAFITIGSVGLATQLETTFDFNDFLPDDLDITKDLEFMMQEFNTSIMDEKVNILIVGDISDPELLRDLDETINNMRDTKGVSKDSSDDPEAQSILSVMQDWATNETQFGRDNYDPDFHEIYIETMTDEGIPKDNATKENISELYDWLYNNPITRRSVQNVLYRTDDGSYEGAVIRISINVDSNDDEAIAQLQNDLEEDKKPLERSADKAIVTGGPILTKTIMDSLNDSQIRSLIITIIISFIVLTIVFWYKWKSFILGLITITPVAFCVTWTLGTMYLVGISLNMMTITIASLTIGLGITYGIHITHRFLEDLKNNSSSDNFLCKMDINCKDCGKTIACSGKPGELVNINCEKCGATSEVKFEKTVNESYIDIACRNTVLHTGTALFGAATTTIAGFGILVFALMPPIQQFGGITALTILYSFLASVFVLPTFLVMWAKWKEKHKKIIKI